MSLKFKVNDWVWFCVALEQRAFKGKIKAVNQSLNHYVIQSGDAHLSVWINNIINLVEPADIPVEPVKPLGLFERVAMCIDNAMRGTR